jgi:hypothetical protein
MGMSASRISRRTLSGQCGGSWTHAASSWAGALGAHLLADADVDQHLGEQATIDDGRQRAVAHRQAELVHVLERELLHVRRIGADDAHAEHDLEHVVDRERVDPLLAGAPEQVGRLLDPSGDLLGHDRDQRRTLGLPQQVTQAELGRHPVDAVRALRRLHLLGQALEALAVDDEEVAGLLGAAGLLDQAPQEQLRGAHASSSSRIRAMRMLAPSCSPRAFRTSARKLEIASGSDGLSWRWRRILTGVGLGGVRRRRRRWGRRRRRWRPLDQPLDQVLRLAVPGVDPVLRQGLLGLGGSEAEVEGAEVVADLDAEGRVVLAGLQVLAGVEVELGEGVAVQLALLGDGAERIGRVIGPEREQVDEDLVAVGGRQRERGEPAVGSSSCLRRSPPVDAEVDEVLVQALEDRASQATLLLRGGGEFVLGLQRAVGGRTLEAEELLAEVSQAAPLGGADQLAALQSDADRRGHADLDLDRLAVELLQRAVVALAEEAQEQVDDHRLEAEGLAQVLGDRGPGPSPGRCAGRPP